MNKELRQTLLIEKKNNIRYLKTTHLIKIALTKDPDWVRYKFFKYMRLSNYYAGTLLGLFYLRKKNSYGFKLNYEINGQNISPGITAYHNGPIVIHKNAIIGKNVKLHGDNCIGNDGITDDCPVIGDNVDIGVGAKIIGKVKIANNVIIGAGSVVVTDITESGAVVVGVPGKVIKKKAQHESKQ